MGMLEDVMKALERIPIWKRVIALPDRMDQLERRIAAIEKLAAGGAIDGCPICNSFGFVRISTRKHPQFGAAGLMLDLFRCEECEHQEERERDVSATR